MPFSIAYRPNFEGFLLHQIHDIEENGNALRPKSGRRIFQDEPFTSYLNKEEKNIGKMKVNLLCM